MTHFHKLYHAPGTAPGTYDSPRVRESRAPRVTVFDYTEAESETHEGLAAVSRERPFPGGVRWVHVAGRPNLEVLHAIRDAYAVDALALEDVVNQGQRPKLNIYRNGIFVTLSVPRPEHEERLQQMSLFVGDGLVTSFMEEDTELLATLHARLENGSSRLRKGGAPFLFYGLVDLAIDLLFPVLDELGTEISDLEGEILEGPGDDALPRAHVLRNRLLLYRRAAWATREMLSDLFRHLESEGRALQPIRPFLQDCYDHVVSAIDLLESYREIAASLVEVYLSVSNNRLNDIMRLLTIIATIFIPPTFIVGVYGMNFDRRAGPLSMPELGWSYGYLAVMLLCFGMIVSLLVYFRARKWL